jgi:iron complex outermembrane receptor protein
MVRAVLWIAALALGGFPPGAGAEKRCGRVVDAQSGEGLAGVWLELRGAQARSAYSDTGGFFCFGALPAAPCTLAAERLGYEPFRAALDLFPAALVVRLRPQPLLLEGLTVRARQEAPAPVAAFVEQLPVVQHRPLSLPQLLERAVGVQVRHQGGLGSFSTASIRGSTAEQVLVFLDGVPLNQAIGGGVDLGRLLVGGVERVEVYRGAVPARFGGNSLGGVVNLHTRAPAARPRLALQGMAGSFGTWQASATLSGPWKGGQYLGLLEGIGSRNRFAFKDDNGTPYNLADDERATRRNADFSSLRSLLKAEKPWGRNRVRGHHTLDLRHQGIPGIGNYQARRVRFDSWQDLGQVEVSGPLSPHSSFEVAAYHSLQQDRYKDPAGEVGTGVQRHRNTTRGGGVQGTAHFLWGARAAATLTGRARSERFAPRDLLRPLTRLPASRRHGALLGGEGEVGLGDLRLALGGQVEALWDRRARTGGPAPPADTRRVESLLAGGQLGAEWRMGGAWEVQAHLGRHQRAPSFYELFGDRGAVIGNPDLRRERGVHLDAGLAYAPAGAGGARLFEVAWYRKYTRDLIRFAQNSQQVSRPHNIGRALVRGVELRGGAALRRLRLSGNYTYQRALNRSPFPFEQGRDLPNAPRHTFNLRTELAAGGVRLFHELNGESRQYLDRANLRRVAARLFQALGASAGLGEGLEATFEVRNLGDEQVEDLWGYPLPGRSFFLVIHRGFTAAIQSPNHPKPQE